MDSTDNISLHIVKVTSSFNSIYIEYRLYGKCARMVYTRELLTYQKSNDKAQRTSEISDTIGVVKYRTKNFPPAGKARVLTRKVKLDAG